MYFRDVIWEKDFKRDVLLLFKINFLFVRMVLERVFFILIKYVIIFMKSYILMLREKNNL